ncbi:hypothetical protein [Kitasatospora sp. NPDC094011]|uniref:hypothetical protein n=1 Tax=Kitasatospora sp. NPDC094011 TaxID=3364090 RepID=UPI00380B1B28
MWPPPAPSSTPPGATSTRPGRRHRCTGALRRTAEGLTATLVERHPTRMGGYSTRTWTLGLHRP